MLTPEPLVHGTPRIEGAITLPLGEVMRRTDLVERQHLDGDRVEQRPWIAPPVQDDVPPTLLGHGLAPVREVPQR